MGFASACCPCGPPCPRSTPLAFLSIPWALLLPLRDVPVERTPRLALGAAWAGTASPMQGTAARAVQVDALTGRAAPGSSPTAEGTARFWTPRQEGIQRRVILRPAALAGCPYHVPAPACRTPATPQRPEGCRGLCGGGRLPLRPSTSKRAGNPAPLSLGEWCRPAGQPFAFEPCHDTFVEGGWSRHRRVPQCYQWLSAHGVRCAACRRARCRAFIIVRAAWAMRLLPAAVPQPICSQGRALPGWDTPYRLRTIRSIARTLSGCRRCVPVPCQRQHGRCRGRT
jgi:hypothetical protein